MPSTPPDPIEMRTGDEPVTPAPEGVKPTCTVRSFATLEEMNEHQLHAQVREAMRVKRMTGAERAQWLRDNWDPLQHQATALRAGIDIDGPPRAVHFATIEAKNAYDEEQELKLALAIRAKLGVAR